MHYIKSLFPQSIKNLYHLAQAIVANVYFGFPSKKIKIIGVTGTDGKTTTVQMITKILEEAGKRVAMASTINFMINGVEEKNLSHYTTESSFAVQKFIKRAVESGCEYLVLETSSHSLDQHRVWGVEFQTAVITNVTREHLDYHKTIENYRKAKKQLFRIVAKNKGAIIVNLDMEKPEEFLDFNDVTKYGYTSKISNNQFSIFNKFSKLTIIKAEDIELGIHESSYEIQNTKYKLYLPALFNIENALGATCVALGEGIATETIKEALEKINGVAGRLESVENARGLNIVVDFALTPEALEKLYSFMRDTKKESSKIIAVFGSCGERDRGKRPIMGEIVSKYADRMIITNDEPYREDPAQIISEIVAGIKNKKEGEEYWAIPDRRTAIAKALEIANQGDTVVVTGMGNFETMVIGDKKIPWNDKAVIQEELLEMDNKKSSPR